MADEGDILQNLDTDAAANGPTPAAPNGADNGPAVSLITQYVKDLSVENPNAPTVYQWNDQPQVDLQFNIGANQVNDEVHEVELKATLTATCEKGQLYLVEVVYAGLFGIRNVPDEQKHAFLFAEAPRLLFPFLRAIVSDAVRDLGFPPFLMEPMDFAALYQQQLAARAQQQGQGAPAPMGEA